MRATFTHLIGPQKGERAQFGGGKISVGRAPDNKLCLGDGARRVSSHHAEVVRRGSEFVLRDLGSTNGTMINGRRVVISELEHDDLIEFGAGGPLLRFGIEQDANQDELETISERHGDVVHSAGAAAGLTRRRTASGLRTNGRLIASLAAAMLLGSVVGIVASSRIRASDPEALSFTEVAELNSPAVVFIRTEFELLDSSGEVTTTEARTGSGFVVSESGLIVTNRHLVRDWEYQPARGATGRVTKIEVVFPHNNREQVMLAEVYRLGPDSSVDVAILRIGSASLTVVRGLEPDLNHTNQGDEVAAIGYPLGLDLLERTRDHAVDPSLTPGIVSRVGHDFIQLNLRAYHGNSGGPVLNRNGEVIGILTGQVGGAQDITLCTPIGAAVALLGAQASLPASPR